MWKDYLSFNKRQRNGIVVLLSLIVIMLGWLIISDHISPAKGDIDFTPFKHEVLGNIRDSVRHNASDSNNSPSHLKNQAGPNYKKISINKCSIKDLSHNPNIGYFLAQAIVNYRELHGPYKKLEDLHNNKAIDDSTYTKIIPYLSIE